LIVNISVTQQGVKNRNSKGSTTAFSLSEEKIDEILFTNKKVLLSYSDRSKVSTAHFFRQF